jgi:hypothetical protein
MTVSNIVPVPGVPAAGDLPGGKSPFSDFLGPQPVAEDRDGVARGCQVRPVDGSDHARTHRKHLHDKLPWPGMNERSVWSSLPGLTWLVPGSHGRGSWG